jgi:hypothetical protein
MRFQLGILLLSSCLVVSLAESQCSAPFQPPSECFDPNDIKDLGPKSNQIESLYNHYMNVLSDAGLTISGDEVKSRLLSSLASGFQLLQLIPARSELFLQRRALADAQKAQISRQLDCDFPEARLASPLSRAWTVCRANSPLPAGSECNG